MEEKKDQSAQATAEPKEPKEDYEKKYKELQGKSQQEIEKLREEIATKEQMLEAVTPYVNWDAAQGKQTPEGEPEFIDKRTFEDTRRRDNEQRENEILELKFERDNPDLKPYMKYVKAELMEARIKEPRATKQQLLERAAENTRKFIESEREKVRREQSEAKRKEDEALLAGLDAQGNTSPPQEERGQTNEEYLAERKAELRKRMGLTK